MFPFLEHLFLGQLTRRWNFIHWKTRKNNNVNAFRCDSYPTNFQTREHTHITFRPDTGRSKSWAAATSLSSPACSEAAKRLVLQCRDIAKLKWWLQNKLHRTNNLGFRALRTAFRYVCSSPVSCSQELLETLAGAMSCRQCKQRAEWEGRQNRGRDRRRRDPTREANHFYHRNNGWLRKNNHCTDHQEDNHHHPATNNNDTIAQR